MSNLTSIIYTEISVSRLWMSLNNDTGRYQVEVDCQEGESCAGTDLHTDLTKVDAYRLFFEIINSIDECDLEITVELAKR